MSTLKMGSIFLAVAACLAAQGPRGPMRERFGTGARFGMGPGGPGFRAPVTGAPYSGVQTSVFQQVLEGGNTIQRQDQTKVYRDQQGRNRHETTVPASPNGRPAKTLITIFDPVAGYMYRLDAQNKTAFQTPVKVRSAPSTDPGPPHSNRPQRPNVQTENLGTQVVNGVQATGTRVTQTVPAGTIGNAQAILIVHETWISTDLKVPVMIKTSDPRFGNSAVQLTNIVQAEPDAALFQVPAGYTIKTGRGPGGMGPTHHRGASENR